MKAPRSLLSASISHPNSCDKGSFAQKATFAKPVFQPSLLPRILGQHLGSYIVKNPPVGAAGEARRSYRKLPEHSTPAPLV